MHNIDFFRCEMITNNYLPIMSHCCILGKGAKWPIRQAWKKVWWLSATLSSLHFLIIEQVGHKTNPTSVFTPVTEAPSLICPQGIGKFNRRRNSSTPPQKVLFSCSDIVQNIQTNIYTVWPYHSKNCRCCVWVSDSSLASQSLHLDLTQLGYWLFWPGANNIQL